MRGISDTLALVCTQQTARPTAHHLQLLLELLQLRGREDEAWRPRSQRHQRRPSVDVSGLALAASLAPEEQGDGKMVEKMGGGLQSSFVFLKKLTCGNATVLGDGGRGGLAICLDGIPIFDPTPPPLHTLGSNTGGCGK